MRFVQTRNHNRVVIHEVTLRCHVVHLEEKSNGFCLVRTSCFVKLALFEKKLQRTKGITTISIETADTYFFCCVEPWWLNGWFIPCILTNKTMGTPPDIAILIRIKFPKSRIALLRLEITQEPAWLERTSLKIDARYMYGNNIKMKETIWQREEFSFLCMNYVPDNWRCPIKYTYLILLVVCGNIHLYPWNWFNTTKHL